MATPVVFFLYDSSGAPLTTASSFSFLYWDTLGNLRSSPSITNRGDGSYSFTPSPADETTGCAYLIDCGASAYPRWVFGALPASMYIQAFFWMDGSGAAWSGSVCSVGLYSDLLGNARTPPALIHITQYMTLLIPTAADLSLGVSYRVTGPAGAVPGYYSDTVQVGAGGSYTPSPALPSSTTSSAWASSGAAPLLGAPFDPYSQQDLLDLIDRLLPAHYLDPLKSPGPGYELLQAAAQVGARLSLATQRYANSGYVLSSGGGSKAVAVVQLSRASTPSEGITVVVKAGTTVRASKSGRIYATMTDVTFGPADLGPFAVQVQALLNGFDYNEAGPVLAADGAVLEGEIDSIVTLVEDPPLGDPNILVTHTVAATGGADAVLDQFGRERYIYRADGESDSAYRGRIRALPDNISPDAVERTLQQILFPFGVTYNYTETWDMSYQTCWDAPPDPIDGSVFNPNLFAFDDTRYYASIRNRWMDENEYRGCFIVSVPSFGPVGDVGMAYDDSGANAAALTNTLGSRAASVFDAPSTLAFGYRQGCFDGYDIPRAAAMKTLWSTLQSIKAAGVVAVLEREGA